MNFNKMFVLGRLIRDPEGRETKNGAPVTNFSVATNRSWTQDGERKEETEFHNVVVYGNQGRSCAEYLVKGSLVLVEGRVQTRSWESEGVTRYRTEIVAERVQFGPRGGDRQDAEDWGDREVTRRTAPETAPLKPDSPPAGSGYEYPQEDINPEDIPF
ncbi:MAG: single-stranded DNA-binding protein [Thalassobaculum sp.]|uniref:single-stranded DNA-binding protein n=1 Tax=Thalassobaculum sp. TaxID=2022740 RepID=UPI0032EF73FA